MSMTLKLCLEVKALFVGVYSDNDSTELSVTACVKKDEKDVSLDFSFFIEVLDDDLNFTVFDDGSWIVEYVYGYDEISWFPDVPRVSSCLEYDGIELKFVKSE